MRSLAQVVCDAARESPGVSSLMLQLRLRAAADALVQNETPGCERDEVLLGCQAYLHLIIRAADADFAVSRVQHRSERYLKIVDGAVSRAVSHGSDLLESLLRGHSGVGQSAGHDSSCHPPSVLPASPVCGSIWPAGRGEGSALVLTHGFSPFVVALLLQARHTHFTLLIAEASVHGDGHRTADIFLKAGVPVRMIEPCAIAQCMGQVQLVLCGAHAVLGDGGVVARVGTLTMAYAARAHGRPLYIAAPHYAFSATHHLDAAASTVVRATTMRPSLDNRVASRILHEDPKLDATPPQLVTLIFTDIGVLTPSAVADEILQWQQG
jgi:hypothetical protein